MSKENNLECLPEEPLGLFISSNIINNKMTNNSIVNISNEDTMSYNTFFLQTLKLAAALKKFNIKQNDVISICSENNLHFFQPVIAALYLGIISAQINFNYTPREIIHAVSIVEPKIIFCSLQSAHKILKVTKDAPYIQKIVLFESDEVIEGTQSVNNFINEYSEDNITINDIIAKDINVEEQIAFVMYSSGTTGLPKGVMITQKNVHAALKYFNDPLFHLSSTSEYTLSFLPFCHAFGFMLMLRDIIHLKKIILLPKFQEQLYLEIIQNYKIDVLYLPPTLVVRFAKSSLVEQFDLSHVRDVICASAPLNKETEKQFLKKLNIEVIRQAYGMTETTWATMLIPLNQKRHGSVGKMVSSDLSVKVIDVHTGKTLGSHENGEICIKGASVTKGYFNNKAATAALIDEDGWLHSGDLGYYDQDEFFYIVDRIKELIKYKGFQVPPAELEKLLLTHPKILDAGVVGIPDEVAGELPLALVVKSHENCSEKDVQQFVEEQVSPEKRLRGGIIFVNKLPRNSVGKLLRPELREMAKEIFKNMAK